MNYQPFGWTHRTRSLDISFINQPFEKTFDRLAKPWNRPIVLLLVVGKFLSFRLFNRCEQLNPAFSEFRFELFVRVGFIAEQIDSGRQFITDFPHAVKSWTFPSLSQILVGNGKAAVFFSAIRCRHTPWKWVCLTAEKPHLAISGAMLALFERVPEASIIGIESIKKSIGGYLKSKSLLLKFCCHAKNKEKPLPDVFLKSPWLGSSNDRANGGVICWMSSRRRCRALQFSNAVG